MGQKVNPISNRLGIIPIGMAAKNTETLCWKIAKSVNI